ncbi:MAG: ABC transporter ATP-binding protein [Saprospiraceae bacterium]|nr:ABC transporter ATP-binding protein [Saprospiraceae bacterium]NNL91576.1 ABC transporter ATP-binding protein [Saprospiraceae bacterium]
MEVLNMQNVSKFYGKIKALDDLSLQVNSGQVLGLLGPNGSGKTTTLGIILGILKADRGSFTWFGNTYNGKHRLKIGSILETPNFFPYLNADDNLDIVRQIKNVPPQKFDELLDLVNLTSRRKSNFRTYSLGMKQRLAIAATLIGDPEVVIFDEPTNGLDPQGIKEVRSTLKKIASRGKTVIMASHILDEVEKICSHVAIIKRGKLLATGPVGAILNNDLTIEVASKDIEQLLGFLRSDLKIKNINQLDKFIECQVSSDFDIGTLNANAFKHGINLTHLVSRKRRLEEEFLEITK